MCQLLKLKSTAMTGKVAAIFVILIFCFAECAAGSCLSYGHSCWGGHGKRSDGAPTDGVNQNSPGDPLTDTRWILSRLIQAPVDVRSWKSQNEAVQKHSNLDNINFIKNDIQDEQDPGTLEELPSNDDALYMDEQPGRHRTAEDKIRLFKLIQKNINRLN